MAEEQIEKKKRRNKNKGSDKKSSSSNPVGKYLRETRGELNKVTWPTRQEATRLTLIVLGVTAAFALFLWGFDSIFSQLLQLLLEQIV